MAPLSRPVPDRSDLDDIFYDALSEGRLIFQQSAHNAWLPPRGEDPVTLSTEWEWVEATGDARLISWVTYHTAYHPYFEDKLPYQVAVVELAEGPRMIAPLDTCGEGLLIEMPLRLDIRQDGGQWLPVFVPVEEPEPSDEGA